MTHQDTNDDEAKWLFCVCVLCVLPIYERNVMMIKSPHIRHTYCDYELKCIHKHFLKINCWYNTMNKWANDEGQQNFISLFVGERLSFVLLYIDNSMREIHKKNNLIFNIFSSHLIEQQKNFVFKAFCTKTPFLKAQSTRIYLFILYRYLTIVYL